MFHGRLPDSEDGAGSESTYWNDFFFIKLTACKGEENPCIRILCIPALAREATRGWRGHRTDRDEAGAASGANDWAFLFRASHAGREEAMGADEEGGGSGGLQLVCSDPAG